MFCLITTVIVFQIFSSKFIEDPHCLEKVAANCESSGEFENAIVARIRLLEVRLDTIERELLSHVVR